MLESLFNNVVNKVSSLVVFITYIGILQCSIIKCGSKFFAVTNTRSEGVRVYNGKNKCQWREAHRPTHERARCMSNIFINFFFKFKESSYNI